MIKQGKSDKEENQQGNHPKEDFVAISCIGRVKCLHWKEFPRCEYEEVWLDTRQVLTQCYWIIFDFLIFPFFVMTSCRKRVWVARSILLMMSNDSLWLEAGGLLCVCLFSFLCFFLVTIFPCYDEQWLVVNGGRVAGLGARSKPRGECHRFMAEQLPAPPAPPQHPKLSSRLQLLILYSASFKSTLGTSSWPLTIFPLGSQKEKQPNCPRTNHWQYPNTLMRLSLGLDNLGGSLQDSSIGDLVTH